MKNFLESSFACHFKLVGLSLQAFDLVNDMVYQTLTFHCVLFAALWMPVSDHHQLPPSTETLPWSGWSAFASLHKYDQWSADLNFNRKQLSVKKMNDEILSTYMTNGVQT